MPALRHLAILHRCVLAWFLLSIGAAVAAPILNPVAMELVCSAVGTIKLVVQTDDGAQEVSSLGTHCALCIPTGSPPPTAVSMTVTTPAPLGRAVESIPAARLAAATAAPLPARGPPHPI
jgi:hypothetical protein